MQGRFNLPLFRLFPGDAIWQKRELSRYLPGKETGYLVGLAQDEWPALCRRCFPPAKRLFRTPPKARVVADAELVTVVV
jgi:hypothetical protein